MHAALHLQAGHKANPSPTDKTVKPHCLFANATWTCRLGVHQSHQQALEPQRRAEAVQLRCEGAPELVCARSTDDDERLR